MNAEQQCIEFAISYRQKLLDVKMVKIRLWSLNEWPTVNDCKPNWKPSLAGKLFQVLFLPMAILLVVLMALLTRLINFFEQHSRRKTLREEKRDLARLAAPYPVPTEKNLHALWRHYKPDDRFGDDCGIRLLIRWIEILYGRETANRFDLRSRFKAIRARQFMLNDGWYRGEADVPHFHFLPITDCLVRELTNELPAYQV